MEGARTWVPRGLALAAFAMYAIAAPPTFYWLDSAELSAAAAGWGSPHPTGFPVYCMVARVAALVPIGELAFRVNLFSAACAAATVLWVARLIVENARDDRAALTGAVAGGGALALALVFFRQATVAEVYAPTAALIASSLLLLSRVARGADGRTGLALAMIAGLGLGVHSSFRLLLAAPLIALFAVRLYRGARWPLLGALLALGVGAAAHAYLPVRAATGRTTAIDWGHPRELGALADHAVTAERIRTAFDTEIASTSAGVVRHNARVLGEQIVDQLGPIALLAALGGLVWLARRGRAERWLLAALVVVIAGDAVYGAWLNPMGLRDLQNGVPLVVGVAAAAGIGVAWLARLSGAAAAFAGGAAAVMVIVPIALHGWTERWAAAGSYAPRAWAERALDEARPRAIALVTNDSTAAGLLLVQSAEGARPDLPVLVLQHIARDRERTIAVLRAADSPVDPHRVRPELLQAPGGVLWELGPELPPRGLRVVAGAPLAELVIDDGAAEADDVASAVAALDHMLGGDGDPAARMTFANGLTHLGLLSYRRRDLAGAEALFRAAVAIRERHAPAWVNLGVVLGRQKRWQEAVVASERAMALDPLNAAALLNAARYRFQIDKRDPRIPRYVARALALAPDRSSAWELAGILEANRGRYAEARKLLLRALALDPGNEGAKWTLDRLPK